MTDYKNTPCDWWVESTSRSVETLCGYLKCASDNFCKSSVECSDLALSLIKENFGTYICKEKKSDIGKHE
jgi:hypothetical protein